MESVIIRNDNRKDLSEIYNHYHEYGLNIEDHHGISFINIKVSVPKKSDIIINNKPFCGKRLARHFENAIIKNGIIGYSELRVECEERDEIWNENKKDNIDIVDISDII